MRMTLSAAIAVMLAVSTITAHAETVWSNDLWTVDRRDPQNDEDDYACQLVGRSRLASFTIRVSEEYGSAHAEFPLMEGQSKPTLRDFPVTMTFDGGDVVRLKATYIMEYDYTTGQLAGLSEFLEKFSQGNSLVVTGGGIDRTVSLKGSRAASNALLTCLGQGTKTAKRFVNSEVYYGSRAGMSATVVDEAGLDTGSAEIRLEHTRGNAKAYCEGYVLDTSEKCVNDAMADVRFKSDRVYGNCQTGEFVDMWNGRYRFEGKNHDPDVMAEFRIRYLEKDMILDGSSASGYGTAMGVLKALCPKRASSEGWN